MIIVPPQGTAEFNEFVKKAHANPSGAEAIVLHESIARAQQQYAVNIRKMLDDMMELVPGQLFRDVSRFHEKFDLQATEDPGHRLSAEITGFRVRFMLEELREYCEAVGHTTPKQQEDGTYTILESSDHFNANDAFDSLIDLAYVALGTAFLHRFPFNEGWKKVQDCNMAKVRVLRPEDSKRGSRFDVVKPPGWLPPDHSGLLGFGCDSCSARSTEKSRGSVCDREFPSGLKCAGKMA